MPLEAHLVVLCDKSSGLNVNSQSRSSVTIPTADDVQNEIPTSNFSDDNNANGEVNEEALPVVLENEDETSAERLIGK